MHHTPTSPRSRFSRTRLSLALILLAFPSASRAVDGVLEINQARAASAQGCFAGDTPGFPVEITLLGNYRLTSNLVVPSATTGVLIASALVNLDLNGFTIIGPVQCPSFSTCTGGGGEGSGVAVQSVFAYGATVRNGKIQGFAQFGIQLTGAGHVDGVLVTGIGDPNFHLGTGIEVGEGSIVQNCDVTFVEGLGVQAPGSLVFDSVIRDVAIAVGGTLPLRVATRNLRIFRVSNTLTSAVQAGPSVCDNAIC